MIIFAALMTLLICLPGAFYPLISGIVIIILSPALGGMSGGLSGMIAVILWGGTYMALSFTGLSVLGIYVIGLATLFLFVEIASIFSNRLEKKDPTD